MNSFGAIGGCPIETAPAAARESGSGSDRCPFPAYFAAVQSEVRAMLHLDHQRHHRCDDTAEAKRTTVPSFPPCPQRHLDTNTLCTTNRLHLHDRLLSECTVRRSSTRKCRRRASARQPRVGRTT